MTATFDPSSPTAEAIRQRYLKVDTATVADVLDAMGHFNCGLAPEFAPYPADAGKMPAGLTPSAARCGPTQAAAIPTR
jgi:hypothetical protein